MSTAIGAAITHSGPAFALLGDLTFLHDQNGLLVGPIEPMPQDLALVVLDNNGGGIFSLLPERATGSAFERVFTAPHDIDLTRVAATANFDCYVVNRVSDLETAIGSRGLRVVLIRTELEANAKVHAHLAALAQAVIQPL